MVCDFTFFFIAMHYSFSLCFSSFC